jgi:hypothetical protein
VSNFQNPKVPPTGGSHLPHAHPSSFEMRRTVPVPTRGAGDGQSTLISPEVLEPIGRELGVADGVLDDPAPSVHPIRGDEIRALRKLRRENPTEAHVFVTERGGPIDTIGFHHLIRLGKAAKMPFPLHPHMLRHACGYKLANDGHDTRALQHYLGRRSAHRVYGASMGR